MGLFQKQVSYLDDKVISHFKECDMVYWKNVNPFTWQL